MKTRTVEATKRNTTKMMPRIMFLLSLSAMLFMFCGSMAAATVTYGVGACGQVGVTSFATITEALEATPTPNVVQVCPGTYHEQVVIKTPLTLEGIVANGEGQAFIAVPTGGLKVNATDEFGDPIAVGVFVDNVAGTVNISDIGVDGSGNGITDLGTVIAGIFYENSSGTVNHVETRYQQGNQNGTGILAESGSSPSTVTVEGSNVHDFDSAGVFMLGHTSELTATVEGNSLVAGKNITSFGGCIYISGLTSVTISANFINGQGSSSSNGIFIGQNVLGGAPTGSLSNNTITYTETGINNNAGDVSVTSNKLYDILGTAIVIENPVAVQNNTIMQAQNGIDFQCQNATNVSSNTFVAIHSVGINDVLASVTSTNAYFNVPTTRSIGFCE